MSGSVAVVNLDDATSNPYLACMVEALRAQGVSVSHTRMAPLAVLRARRAGVSAVHVHWPEYLVLRTGRLAGLRELLAFVRVAAALLICRLVGLRIVWTVHNLRPHEPTTPRLRRWSYPLLAATAHVFVTHSRDAAVRVAGSYTRARERAVVAPHGNYAGIYGTAVPHRAQALRERYAIPSTGILLLAFGQVRAYKRLAELAQIIASGPADLHLLIAGSPVDEDHAALVREVAADTDRVHVDLRRIPDEEVADLYAASDLAILHYTEVFSSGALLLALTEGTAVLTPRSEAAGEVGDWPAIIFYVGDAVEPAVREALTEPRESRRAAALRAASSASWTHTARRLATAYFGTERERLSSPSAT